ncbi:hypothetical protein E0494_04540 [Marinilabiliaceae bacterium JC040]|nr:hypothetical protein [Marinilabiliaceae bacterium JC040]
MKKLLFLGLSVVLAFFVLSSCSKDKDKEEFDYPMESLIGKWQITHIQLEDGKMFNVSSNYGFKATYATFKKDGTYSGMGQFGNGSGTYKAEGSTVTCYVDGKAFIKYKVISLEDDSCELDMYIPGDDKHVRIKCKKI